MRCTMRRSAVQDSKGSSNSFTNLTCLTVQPCIGSLKYGKHLLKSTPKTRSFVVILIFNHMLSIISSYPQKRKERQYGRCTDSNRRIIDSSRLSSSAGEFISEGFVSTCRCTPLHSPYAILNNQYRRPDPWNSKLCALSVT